MYYFFKVLIIIALKKHTLVIETREPWRKKKSPILFIQGVQLWHKLTSFFFNPKLPHACAKQNKLIFKMVCEKLLLNKDIMVSPSASVEVGLKTNNPYQLFVLQLDFFYAPELVGWLFCLRERQSI